MIKDNAAKQSFVQEFRKPTAVYIVKVCRQQQEYIKFLFKKSFILYNCQFG